MSNPTTDEIQPLDWDPMINLAPDLGQGIEAAFNRIIAEAIQRGVSDIYLHPNEDSFEIAFRHFGIPQRVAVVPTEAGRKLASHLKIVAGMDLTERRRPQDGRRPYDFSRGEGQPRERVDLRINTIPTLYGEDCTIRLLMRESQLLHIESLGFATHDLNNIRAMLNNSSGLIMCTGPTGTGKTTTLYAFLRQLNNGRCKISTIEDPIEYTLPGIRQSQVNPVIGLDFPDLIRSVLRQAPDVILIGETRDQTAAQVTVRAANSGHLVLTTLHAAVAAAAIQSMRSLHSHPQFLATALLGVISQRLVRTLCKNCRQEIDISLAAHAFTEVDRWLAPGEGKVLYAPKGCDECHHTGYQGRTAVYEVLVATPRVRQLIADGAPTTEIRKAALQGGMIEFRQAALLKVARGETSLEEVFRVVPTEYLILDD